MKALTWIAVFVLAFIFFGLVYAQGQIQIAQIVTSVFLDPQTQDLYFVKTVNGQVIETERVPPIQRMQYQSPLENYFMYKAVQKK